MEDKKLTNDEVGKMVILNTLGHTVDMHIAARDIGDPELQTLWLNAETALNEIQLYLENALGEDYFNGSN
jgi:hypothetical protein